MSIRLAVQPNGFRPRGYLAVPDRHCREVAVMWAIQIGTNAKSYDKDAHVLTCASKRAVRALAVRL
jgi:hypothetical protein